MINVNMQDYSQLISILSPLANASHIKHKTAQYKTTILTIAAEECTIIIVQ